MTFKSPPVTIPLDIKDHRVTVTASALLKLTRQDRGVNVLTAELSADLSDLQQNMTELLGANLNKEEQCGDRILVQQATLQPQEPASLAVVHLHVERWTCVKLFGRQNATKLIAGNAVIRIKLTPLIENNTTIHLDGEVESIEADGSLGELLRSGPLGEMLRDKIKTATQSAMQKGLDLGATLPAAVRGYATIRGAQFKNAGSGRLEAILVGEIRINDEQLQSLSKEIKPLMQRP